MGGIVKPEEVSCITSMHTFWYLIYAIIVQFDYFHEVRDIHNSSVKSFLTMFQLIITQEFARSGCRGYGDGTEMFDGHYGANADILII
jgi:hypothetical protein